MAAGRESEIYVDQGDHEPTYLRSGDIYWCEDDQLNYRVIRLCAPEDGWATAEHWCGRYKIGHQVLLQMVRRGLFDGALEHDSPTKRYRVRSEQKVREWISCYRYNKKLLDRKKARRNQ